MSLSNFHVVVINGLFLAIMALQQSTPTRILDVRYSIYTHWLHFPYGVQKKACAFTTIIMRLPFWLVWTKQKIERTKFGTGPKIYEPRIASYLVNTRT